MTADSFCAGAWLGWERTDFIRVDGAETAEAERDLTIPFVEPRALGARRVGARLP